MGLVDEDLNIDAREDAHVHLDLKMRFRVRVWGLVFRVWGLGFGSVLRV